MRQLLRLGVQRSPASLGLVAIMALGMLVAAALLASAPIYSRAMSDLGLTYAVRNQVVGKPYTEATFFNVPIGTSEGTGLQQAIATRLDQRVGWFAEGTDRSFQMGRFVITKPGQAPKGGEPQAQPMAMTDAAAHERVVEGRLPRTTAAGAPIELTISRQGAQMSGLKVGDSIVLNEEFDNCQREMPNPGAPPPPPCPVNTTISYSFPAKVVGIVEPDNANSQFWTLPGVAFFAPYRLSLPNTGPVIPMMTTPQTLLNGFAKEYPSYVANMSWVVKANPEKLTRTNYERAIADINGLSKEFSGIGGVAYSPLRDALLSFGTSASYQQTPLLVLLLELTGIALFYVMIIAGLVVERQSAEISLLRSRGATVRQVAVLYVVEALLLGIPVFLVAPFLSAGATALLGLTPPFHAVSNGSLLPVTITPLALPLAALGVFLSMVAFVLPAVVAARRNTLAARRLEARPRRPFAQRYYLDVALAAIAILLLYELYQRGSVFTPSPSGSLSSDPLLLASPALVIIAAAAIILRLYPILLRGTARMTRAVAGAAVTLGLWQSTRNPGQYMRLALLLMMAVAVGTFAASYTATVERAHRDQANFDVGTDVRVANTGRGTNSGEVYTLATQAGKLPGVAVASAVVRTTGATAGPGATVNSFQVLGVDPSVAGTMLWTRPDLANEPLSTLIARLAGPPGRIGEAIPADAKTLSIQIRSGQNLPTVNLYAGVFDATGRFSLVALGDLSNVKGGWHTVSVNLTNPDLALKMPLRLETLAFSGTVFVPSPAPIELANLTATNGAGQQTVVDSLSGSSNWSEMPSTSPNPDTFSVEAAIGPSGGRAGSYQFHDLTLGNGSLRGIYFNNLLTPMPAIVSDSFVSATGVGEGGKALLSIQENLVPIVVVGTFHQFPTTATQNGPTVVVNRDWLVEWTKAMAGTSTLPVMPSELWLSLRPGGSPSKVASALAKSPFGFQQVMTRASALKAVASNPLIAASGSGILLAAFIGILVLVGVAILSSLVAAMTRREVEFAVVRALGLSRLQFFGMLTLEYGLVFVVGIGAGVPLGLFISDRMLGFLNVTQSGTPTEPPFILETQWLVVGVGVAIVLAVFVVALGAAGFEAIRKADGRALRGE